MKAKPTTTNHFQRFSETGLNFSSNLQQQILVLKKSAKTGARSWAIQRGKNTTAEYANFILFL